MARLPFVISVDAWRCPSRLGHGLVDRPRPREVALLLHDDGQVVLRAQRGRGLPPVHRLPRLDHGLVQRPRARQLLLRPHDAGQARLRHQRPRIPLRPRHRRPPRHRLLQRRGGEAAQEAPREDLRGHEVLEVLGLDTGDLTRDSFSKVGLARGRGDGVEGEALESERGGDRDDNLGVWARSGEG